MDDHYQHGKCQHPHGHTLSHERRETQCLKHDSLHDFCSGHAIETWSFFMLVDVTLCPNRSLGSGSGGGRLWRWLAPTSSCRTPFCLRFILKQPRHAYSFQDDSISSQNYGNQNLLSPTMTCTKELVLTNCKLTSVFFLSPFFGWLGDKPRSAILYSLDKPTHHKTQGTRYREIRIENW